MSKAKNIDVAVEVTDETKNALGEATRRWEASGGRDLEAANEVDRLTKELRAGRQSPEELLRDNLRGVQADYNDGGLDEGEALEQIFDILDRA